MGDGREGGTGPGRLLYGALVRGHSWVVLTKMLPNTGLLRKWMRGGVYFCGKRVSIMWLALGRAAAGFQQTPSEVQTTLHTLKSPWAYSPWTYHPTPLMPGASPLIEGCVSLVEWGRWAHIL